VTVLRVSERLRSRQRAWKTRFESFLKLPRARFAVGFFHACFFRDHFEVWSSAPVGHNVSVPGSWRSLTSTLNYPNVCTICEIVETHGQPFIVMEFLDARTLKDFINGNGSTSMRSSTMGIQVADALDAAHAQRIIHRDPKPANISSRRKSRAATKRLLSDSAGQSLILRTLRKANHRVPEETQASSAQDDRIAAQSRFLPQQWTATDAVFFSSPFSSR